jgi:hypothetical protein
MAGFIAPLHRRAAEQTLCKGTPSVDDEESALASVVEHLEARHTQEPTAVDVRETDSVLTTPQAALKLLLVIDRRRTMAFDPETTVGNVKGLASSTWPSGASAVGSAIESS